MTVLGLLVASFITQGQPFLPTFSTQASFQSEKIQQHSISSQHLSALVVPIDSKSNLSASKNKYQKVLVSSPNTLFRLGSHKSISKRRYQRKITYSPSLNVLPVLQTSFGFSPKKEWDMPQAPLYDAKQRLLAQYYQGRQLPVLRYGNTGNAVRVLQTLLMYNRYRVRITGDFDVLTEAAVKAFQSNRRLAADGIVGSRTWRELTKYTAYYSKKNPMEIPMFGNEPLLPWQRSFRGNFAESTLSI
ncbi:MAG: peptidoglycan-binding protein [Rivularia sp. (in: Bacteria)]|nr:peptidoglycan-binding protein [Rivularia sp. MS3]